MAVAAESTPATIDELIGTIRQEFPDAGIRITGRARTIRSQATLMAERIRANRAEFMGTYAHRAHILEMDRWVTNNRNATLAQTIDEFERIIQVARANGEIVSNHLSDSARDISWPIGAPDILNQIEQRIEQLRGRVIREPRAAGGRHWHVDW